jgi:hypothetical protein
MPPLAPQNTHPVYGPPEPSCAGQSPLVSSQRLVQIAIGSYETRAESDFSDLLFLHASSHLITAIGSWGKAMLVGRKIPNRVMPKIHLTLFPIGFSRLLSQPIIKNYSDIPA